MKKPHDMSITIAGTDQTRIHDKDPESLGAHDGDFPAVPSHNIKFSRTAMG